MKHEIAWQHLPDLLERGGESDLRRHVARCHACQRQLFLLQRVDALLRSRPRTWEPRGRPSRVRRILGLLAAAAVVAAIALALVVPRGASVRELTFQSAGAPEVVVHGSVSPGDATNAVLTIKARGLPLKGGNGNFLLWASTESGDGRVLVGRFMANPSGECTARFNLPGDYDWMQFWITAESEPTTIVAAAL
jgi:hypothetical protein